MLDTSLPFFRNRVITSLNTRIVILLAHGTAYYIVCASRERKDAQSNDHCCQDQKLSTKFKVNKIQHKHSLNIEKIGLTMNKSEKKLLQTVTSFLYRQVIFFCPSVRVQELQLTCNPRYISLATRMSRILQHSCQYRERSDRLTSRACIFIRRTRQGYWRFSLRSEPVTTVPGSDP